jgi:hypothetical protein
MLGGIILSWKYPVRLVIVNLPRPIEALSPLLLSEKRMCATLESGVLLMSICSLPSPFVDNLSLSLVVMAFD